MCVVCGCEGAAVPAEKSGVRVDPATGDLDYGAGAARVSVPGMSTERVIKLEADVLGENARLAAANRAHFADHGVTALNLVSSPGAGKTTLLVATIRALQKRRPGLRLAVIEGDQQTSNDAARIRATGAPAIQVNTGKGCHLDARMVAEAFSRLPLHGHGHGHSHGHGHGHGHASHPPQHGHRLHAHDGPAHDHHAHEHHPHEHHAHDDADHADDADDADHAAAPAHADPDALLFIENVGNLVCPALWDLGEAAKVVILSVTEGEDKPLKYPDMFAAARLMLLNKVDLLPHVDFDVERCIANARRIHPDIEVLQVSATRGDGLDEWLAWLRQPGAAVAARAERIAALERQVAELQAALAAARRGG